MEISDSDIRSFQEAILEHSEYDFSEYTTNSLRRRLTKILEEFDNNMDRLLEAIGNDPSRMEQIIKKITVSTTELFRDPDIWKRIMYSVLPRYAGLSSINIWHPGCSTGQEVYSMMILLDHMGILEKCNIYATDINTDALSAAERGEYRYRFNKTYLDHFNQVFCSGEDDDRECYSDWRAYMKVDAASDIIRMKRFLREKPSWEKFDLVKDLDMFNGNFDIIMCRNVIIYFNTSLQNRVLKLFQQNLNRKGCLILGMHESIIGPCSDYFSKEENIYYKKHKTK